MGRANSQEVPGELRYRVVCLVIQFYLKTGQRDMNLSQESRRGAGKSDIICDSHEGGIFVSPR